MRDKIIHKGTIIEKKEDKVYVSINQASACAHCQLKGACNTHECQTKIMPIIVKNAQDFNVGEDVTLSIDQNQAFCALFYAYIFPFILLMISFFGLTYWGISEIKAGIFVLIILIIYYLLLVLLNKYLQTKIQISIEKREDR